VDLRGIPPLRILVAKRRNPALERNGVGRIGRRPRDHHGFVFSDKVVEILAHIRRRPRTRLRYADVSTGILVLVLMAKPVVDLELNPRAGQEIEGGRGLEILPTAHQPLADLERIWK